MNTPPPADGFDISVAIPSWNTKDLTRACLKSLLEGDHGCRIEVAVVDNGSHDGSPDMIASEFPAVKLIRNARNEYYSKASNQGAAAASAPFLCLLNSDTLIPEGSLRKMVDFLKANPHYGAVAPRLVNLDNSVQPICRRFPSLFEVVVDQFNLSNWGVAKRYRAKIAMLDFDHLSSLDVEQPPGACLVMRTADFHRLAGFDETLPLFYSDVDICLRIWRSGHPIRFLADAHIYHVGSASVVRHPLWRAEYMRDQVKFFRKTKGVWAALFAKLVILTSATLVSVRTMLGRRTLRERKELLAQITRSTRTAIGL